MPIALYQLPKIVLKKKIILLCILPHMEKISAWGIAAEILLFFFLKKQKIEAESPTRRGTPF